MRIRFVNAFNGCEEFGGNFFKEFGPLSLIDIRVAQANGGSKEVEKALRNDKNFLGEVKEVKEYEEVVANGLKEKVSYVIFTKEVDRVVYKYDENTGDPLPPQNTKETFTYFLEVRSGC